MKSWLSILLLIGIMLPLRAARRKKVYPMMMGPKVSVGLFEGDESIYPLNVSGDMLLNLYKNYYWLRTDPVSLLINDSGDRFSINTGAPFDFVFMAHYDEWRPYGFGGIEIDVTSENENTITLAGGDFGGGISYEVSKGLHLFAEGGLDVEYL
ncbi:hypothetical protein GF359_05840, partial [candidate division WOR-3 bacterium]|nr:hypothetical protein [candidate division WOR-3 bacterium]MBD3364719.1 hypothetical protein [candidate division WOR-3 bacterium]